MLVVLIHRHFKQISFKYKKGLHNIDLYKMNEDISMKTFNFEHTYFNFEHTYNTTTAHFGGPLTAHFGNALKDNVQEAYRHLRSVDNQECVICGDEIREDSDFAVLDTCNHFMCTDCAEVALMGRVFDVVLNPPEHVEVEWPLGQCRCRCEVENVRQKEVKWSKVPKCPCCNRQVKEWTTSYHIKFIGNNGCGIFCRDRCPLLSNNFVSKTKNYVTQQLTKIMSAANVSGTEKTSNAYNNNVVIALASTLSFAYFSRLFFNLAVRHN